MMNSTITVHSSMYRLYLGLAAMLATFHIFRSTAGRGWDAHIAFIAGASDIVILLLLTIFYFIAEKSLKKSSLLLRANKYTHLILAVVIAMLATASQMLFLATGENLNTNIILFCINNIHDIALVVGGSTGTISMTSILLGWCLFALAFVTFTKTTLNTTRTLLLIFPFAILSACTLIYDKSDNKLVIDLPKNSIADASLYQGIYRAYNSKQTDWLTDDISHWKQGILAGFTISATYGLTEYQALSLNVGSEIVYEAPKFVSKGTTPPNIVLILLESVRYNEVGVYNTITGNSSKTPFIDRLANKGLIYDKAYTTIPHTSKALVGIFCGTFPSFDSNDPATEPGKFPYTCLPQILGSAGYHSAHFQTAPSTFESRGKFLNIAGFDYFMTKESFANEQWEHLGYLGLDDRALINPAINWMKDQRANNHPFFASLLTIATHHPYATPGKSTAITDTYNAYGQYVSGIRYTDVLLAELFERMEADGLTENTIFIITGDHGEGFGEHGQIAHNGTAYEEGMHVPLIIYGPTLLKNKGRIGGLRQHIDIMPTLLELAGIQYTGMLPGKNLLTDSHGHKDIITSCFYTNYCLGYYSDSGFKSIYFYGNRSMELYNLARDPYEKNNISSEYSGLKGEHLSRAIHLKKSYESVCMHDCFSSTSQNRDVATNN